MSSRAEVLRNGAIRRKKPLGLSGGLKSLHTPLSLTRRLMRVFRPIIQISMLAVSHTRHERSLGGFVTFQFIGDEHPWGVRQSLEQLTEERLCGFPVAPALRQDIEDVAVLVDRPPEVMTLTVKREKRLRRRKRGSEGSREGRRCACRRNALAALGFPASRSCRAPLRRAMYGG
jgi:hypothetical protein